MNFRVLKNLGSQIHMVKPYDFEDRSGYYIIYNNGDKCLGNPNYRYESHVKFECDPTSE